MKIARSLALLITCLAAAAAAEAKTLRFSGYDFVVRPAGTGGPGPNRWDPANAWVDGNGHLHLKLSRKNGKWHAAEVYTKERLGYGRYQFEVIGRLDKLDPNVVLGLFNYPTADVGPDATHEIDIDFARWGKAGGRVGNYTVWPVDPKLSYTTHTFAVTKPKRRTTHRFVWGPKQVRFRSLHGHRDGNAQTFHTWTFRPADPARRISRKPMPLHINLWAHKGNPPTDGRDVEIVISRFTFTPR